MTPWSETRRECLDRTLFRTTTDLDARLLEFNIIIIQGHPPVTGVNADHSLANLSCYPWQKHCRGLYQTPMTA